MGDPDPVEMSADDRDEFLGTGGTGVLSLSTAGDAPPFSVPVSYGYDPVDSVFYFRLAVGPDRGKGDLADRPATFVTYGRDGDWRSVVARGRLVDVAEESIGAESLAGLRRVDIPMVDMFGEPSATISFAFVRLDPDELTAHEESVEPT